MRILAGRMSNAEAEVIEIYAREPVSLESQLHFISVEESEGGLNW